MPLLHHLAGVTDHGERFQPEKIHLQEAEIFNRPHRILCGDRAVVVLFERQNVHQRLGPDHNPRRMDGRVSRQVLKNERRVD